MTTTRIPKPLKILRFLEIGFFVGAVLGIAALITGKIWLEHHFLRQEIHLGDGSLRIYGGKLYWDLQFFCDSARYDSPTLQARLGKSEIYARPLNGFIPGAPIADVKLDTLFIHIEPNSKTHTPLDSLSFPALKLPIKVSLNLRALALANDSGILFSAWKIHVRNRGREEAEASIGTLTSPRAGNLQCSLSAQADWSLRDSVNVELNVARAKDQIHLTGRAAKAALLRGHASLLTEMADSRPYAPLLGLGKKTPIAQSVRLEVDIARKDSIEAHAHLQAQVSGFSKFLPLELSPQTLGVQVDGSNHAAQWQVLSQGRAGEALLLKGNIREIPALGNASLPPLKQYSASASGFAKKFRVRTNGKTLLTGARLQKVTWDGRNLSALLTSDDGSRVGAQASQTRGAWTGKFSAHIAPSERWLLAFVDTNVSFDTLDASGTVQGKTITAALSAHRVLAYGVKLDSLSSENTFGPQGYELKSSRLYSKGDVWSLAGKVETGGKATWLDFKLGSPHYGDLEYFQQRDSMQITARQFDVGAVPYALVAKLPVQNPVLDGTFKWNWMGRDGSVDASAVAEFQTEKIQVGAKAHWDSQRLDVENLALNFKTSSLTAAARIKLNGRQFYELSKLRVPDYEYVSLETPRLDLPQVLALFEPRPFLQAGQVHGNLSYADSGGFKGSMVFSGISPQQTIGDIVLKRLQLDGTGDSLIVLGVTQSESTPLLRDSLRIAVTHTLEDTQHIHVEATASDSLHLNLDAVSSHFQALQGRLKIQGKAALPENSGLLDSLQADMNFFLPFRNTLTEATLTSKTFQGEYVIPAVTREQFSLNPELKGGTLRISQLSLKDTSGSTLQGSAEYVLPTHTLHAHFGGGNFAAQWTQDDKVVLKNLNLDFARDSSGMRLTGGFSQGDLKYVDIPLDAEGTLKDVAFTYTRPLFSSQRTGKRSPPSLQFSGSLSSSLIRYSLKSLTAIQALFQKERNKRRGSGRAQPIQLDVKIYTVGDSNRVDSDILRMSWVGDLEMQGLYPFTLVQGRMNALNGELGLPNQAYQIQQLEVKWLNSPLEAGEVQMQARKNLASNCQKTSAPTDFAAQDSCGVIVQLHGPLSQLQFTYDSDCGGAYGAEANVVAILTSVERGCYDPSFANGGGTNYGGTALSLLEPTLSQNLTTLLGRYSHSWIAETDITGLSSLAGGRDTVSDSVSQALSVQVTSKEIMHVRLKIKSGYHTESQDLSTPWENMLALEWRPPLQDLVVDENWKRRLQNHVSVAASVQTVAVERNLPEEDPVQKTLALTYLYEFWGSWWNKPLRQLPKSDTASASGSKP